MSENTKHDYLIEQIPDLMKSINSQAIINEKILSKLERMENSLDATNVRLDRMNARLDVIEERDRVSVSTSVKNVLIRVFELALVTGILFLVKQCC